MTRPFPRLLLALLLAASLLAACGDDSGSDEAGSGSGSGSGSGAFPVEVEHALGTTTIDAEPLRIVTVGVTEQDTVLALGIVPVGVTEWYGDQPYATWPWATEALGDGEPVVLSTSDGLQYEQIAALDPDLIIGTNAGLDEASYETLSAIAPTIAHPVDSDRYFSPWDDQARLIGAALGRSEEMEQIISDIEDAFAEAAAEHPEFDGVSVAFLQNAVYDGQVIAYQEGLSTKFLTDLGFTIPASLDQFATEGQAYIPLEQISVLDDAEVLLWATEEPGDREALEAEPLYNTLQAVRDGKLVFTDGVTAGAIYFTSPLSLPFVLEQIVPAFASTLAGEGPAQIDSGVSLAN